MTRVAAALILIAWITACGADADAGWRMRLDTPGAMDDERLVERKDGLEVRPGPNGTLWRHGLQASGRFRLSAQITHLDSGLHPHGAGIVFGGTNVDGPEQSYTYFLVRGDGHFLVKTRRGAETQDVCPWTRHDAVGVDDELGIAENGLSVEVGATDTQFFVNGTEVHRAPNTSLRLDGQCGFRLVHDLHVHFGSMILESIDS